MNIIFIVLTVDLCLVLLGVMNRFFGGISALTIVIFS